MADIKAVVFDSDGTLMDSREGILKSHDYIAQTFGVPVPAQEIILDQLRRAVPLPQILQTLYPNQPLEELLKANGDYVLSQKFPVFAGVKQLLESLQQRGLALAIVTGGNHRIHDLLAHHDLETLFTSIVHCDRVSFGKPNPEGFLLALEECGVKPEEAIMVGDSPNDIMAGKNGHAAITVGITHGHGSKEDLVAADCDHIVSFIPELQKQLLALL